MVNGYLMGDWCLALGTAGFLRRTSGLLAGVLGSEQPRDGWLLEFVSDCFDCFDNNFRAKRGLSRASAKRFSLAPP